MGPIEEEICTLAYQKISDAKPYDGYVFYSVFDIDEYNFDEEDYKERGKITKVALDEWYCTDQYVGHYAYFYDDVFVAYSEQFGRKSDTRVFFRTQGNATTIEEHLQSFVPTIKPMYSLISELDVK